MDKIHLKANKALKILGPIIMESRANCDAISLVKSKFKGKVKMRISVYKLVKEIKYIEKKLEGFTQKETEKPIYYLNLENDYTSEDCLYDYLTREPMEGSSLRVELDEVFIDKFPKIRKRKEIEFVKGEYPKRGGNDISLGRFRKGYGTIGGIVINDEGDKFILTCYHNFRKTEINRGRLGETVVSPSKDKYRNHPNANIGNIFWFKYSKGEWDIALVKVTNTDRVGSGLTCGEDIDKSLFQGQINEGDIVKFCGNRLPSAFRHGKIKSMKSLKRIKKGKVEYINSAYETSLKSRRGDSGSLVLNKDNQPIGLLFSHNNKRSYMYEISGISEIKENGKVIFKFKQFK